MSDKLPAETMQGTDLKTLDVLARQSLQQYEEIFELLQSMGQQFDTHLTEQIKTFNETFCGLQKMAQRNDRKLTEKLKTIKIPVTVVELLTRRTELQEKILISLKETTSRANNVKSLLANEMQSIKHGRKALSGYKANFDNQPRIINKAS